MLEVIEFQVARLPNDCVLVRCPDDSSVNSSKKTSLYAICDRGVYPLKPCSRPPVAGPSHPCLLYTSDAADE